MDVNKRLAKLEQALNPNEPHRRIVIQYVGGDGSLGGTIEFEERGDCPVEVSQSVPDSKKARHPDRAACSTQPSISAAAAAAGISPSGNLVTADEAFRQRLGGRAGVLSTLPYGELARC